MLRLAGLAHDFGAAEEAVRAALRSGSALEKFRQIVAQQGGDPRVVDDPSHLPAAPQQIVVRATRGGFVADIHAEQVGRAAMLLGAGRERVGDTIDPAVGVIVKSHRGEQVRSGDGLVEVHYRADERVGAALDLLQQAWTIGEMAPPPQPTVLETVTASDCNPARSP
jgi:thymidine phosphorylase